MAAGEAYFNCDNKDQSISAAFRKMLYKDDNGKVVINISSNGSALEPFITCDNDYLTDKQLLSMLIVQDDHGNPVFNIAQT